VADAAFEVFDRRLIHGSSAPIGVAFSGGGDSLMALKVTKDWVDECGRSVIAFHVDHRLQAQSAEWAKAANDQAERLGVRFVGLAWDGAKPPTGLPAAAREARHRLIAEAARAAGVRVLVIGHTADDRIEAGLMRDAGHRMGDLREWSPSPVWPEGRGLFVLRPLLGLRRAAIRQALAAEGETWIDDPLNQDLRSPRARARLQAGPADDPPTARDDADLARLAAEVLVGVGGDIRIDRQALRSASRTAARQLIGVAATCAGGGSGPARGGRLEALTDRVVGAAPFAGVLSGARVLAAGDVQFVRDAGEAARGGLQPLHLQPGETGVWDGRFEITAGADPTSIVRLAGRAAALDRAQHAALKALAAPVRPGLPVRVASNGSPVCPILAEDGLIGVNLLVAERFYAACGVILKEPAA
jgi:tRNA(Ile)-lysidine synthase